MDTETETWPQRCCDCGCKVTKEESATHYLYC
jgi:hypothetical protein